MNASSTAIENEVTAEGNNKVAVKEGLAQRNVSKVKLGLNRSARHVRTSLGQKESFDLVEPHV